MTAGAEMTASLYPFYSGELQKSNSKGHDIILMNLGIWEKSRLQRDPTQIVRYLSLHSEHYFQ
jgi:hypothetical protein